MSHQNRPGAWPAVVVATLVGVVLSVTALIRPPRDERGLSQSTENAILLAGAILVAGLVVTFVTAFVKSNLHP